MYSVYKIYQSEKLVFVTYHDIIPEFTDETKLKLILNGPIIPSALFESYFKTPELFSIETFKTGLSNALDASIVMQEESKLIGTDKPKAKKKTSNNTAKTKTTTTTRKPRAKKVEAGTNED